MANTVIGSSMVINGEISSDADLIIEGLVKGRVIVDGDLFVGNAATVEAEIETRNAAIAGRVNGNISAAQRVEITTGGRAVGDIKAERFFIAEGAVFKGNVDMGA